MASKILVPLILSFFTIGKSANQCARYDKICDPRGVQPCCDEMLSCKLNNSRNSYVCSEKKKLESACSSDEDCSEMLHSKCSADKKCACRSNNIKINETYCAPLLGAFCWRNDVCATLNAECIDSECQCKQNYLKVENQCLRRIITMDCEDDSACESVRFSKCSERKYCTCLMNTIATDSRTCSPILNAFCETNDDCHVENSVCVRNKCLCKPPFTPDSPFECKLRHLGMRCINDVFCDMLISHSICSTSEECMCDVNYDQSSEETCEPKLNVICVDNEKCATENSLCIDNRCQCPLGYVYKHPKCVLSHLNELCINDSDCAAIRHAECSRGRCACRKNNIIVNTMCLPLLGGYCSNDLECYVRNSICVSNKCQCKLRFASKFNQKCEPIALGKKCHEQEECSMIFNAVCSNNICVCRINNYAFSDFLCTPTLNGLCSTDEQCMHDSFHCSSNKCQCKPGFTAVSARQCFPTNSLYSCQTTLDCSDPWHSQCSVTTGKCSCQTLNIAMNNATCLPILDGKCWFDSQCVAENSVCIDYHCTCKLGFTAVAQNMCVMVY